MDYLVEHAIRNVWCNPEQDRQYRYWPHRLSSPQGDYRYVTIMGESHTLPNDTDKFYLFQIGSIPPHVLGLMDHRDRFNNSWIPLSQTITQNKVWCEFYMDYGLQIPKRDIYYKFGIHQNLLFAIRENNRISVDYSTIRPYMRVYSNAFFRSDRVIEGDGLYLNSRIASNQVAIIQMQIEIENHRAKMRGYVFCYVNGYLVDSINVLTAQVGDSIEYLYDTSVRRVVSFPISTLQYFNSELDSQRKYLLSYESINRDSIEYLDDNEVYVVVGDRGVLLHRHLEGSVRMVTHRDYSVSVDRVDYQTQHLGSEGLVGIVRLYIREAGYDRPLVFENSRIHELYKLPFNQRYRAMLGLDASLPYWNAISLEKGDYTSLMRAPDTALQRPLVERTYGYNATSVIIGNTPSLTYLESGRQQISVPIGLWTNSTAYEYDSEGLLLGYYYHREGTLYNTVNDSARLVEMISGRGSHRSAVVFGVDDISLPIGDSYRVYYSHYFGGLYMEDWVDITGSEYYRVENNRLIWNGLDDNQLIMVRNDSGFLAYHLDIVPTDGIIRFTLSEMEDRGNGEVHYILPVPMGELDLWLNGRSLIEGLDYFVHFPEIVICNKDYLRIDETGNPNTQSQSIDIRFTGFCQSDMSRDYFEDYGFITHGVLSRNNRFDIRDDRVLRIIYDGKTVSREDLEFAEGNSGVSIIDSRNGRPYAIRDIIVPMRNKTDENTYVFREKSRVIDKAVSDYLSQYLPEPRRDAPSSMTQRYPLFSPFICKILHDLISGHFPNDKIDPLPDRTTIQALCEPYEEWLLFDPINEVNGIDYDYVVIHPHDHRNTINVNYLQYRFLKAVVELYAKDLVELSPFVAIESLKGI